MAPRMRQQCCSKLHCSSSTNSCIFFISCTVYSADLLKICQVITFDDSGVSRHPNHIAVHAGVSMALSSVGVSMAIEGLQLDTCSLWRKFLGPFDIILAATERKANWAVTLRLWTVLIAMAQHWSQFVWYRFLFILFSRYSYVNTFTRINVSQRSDIGHHHDGGGGDCTDLASSITKNSELLKSH